MNIQVAKGKLEEQSCDLLIVNMFEGTKTYSGSLKSIDDSIDGLLKKELSDIRFTGEFGSSHVLRTAGLIPAKRVLVVGLGKKKAISLERVREVSAVSIKIAKKLRSKKVVSVLHGAGGGKLVVREVSQAIAEGVRLVDYSYTRFKKAKKKKHVVTSFTVVSHNAAHVRGASSGMELGELFARGANTARDLVNVPAGHMYPEVLKDAAKELLSGKKGLRVRVYNREQLEKMGAGSLLGVAQGSDHAPYLVHMIYKPQKKAKKKIAIVGKAVTFDSGGLSLKPSGSMETMKIDMGGAATVLGVFDVLSEVQPSVEVHGIFGAVENMPSGKAIRPGDVLHSMNKKTIEVLNTDAEGRLTLADALTYAQKQKPDVVIDLATLTGACVVALGEEISGVMSNDQKLVDTILGSASSVGEKMWQLPLEKSYKKLIKSDIADVKNIGGRYGGAITAGLFLEEFVDPKLSWAHIDIAGPVFAERPINAYLPKGATGHAVRTLLHYLKSL